MNCDGKSKYEQEIRLPQNLNKADLAICGLSFALFSSDSSFVFFVPKWHPTFSQSAFTFHLHCLFELLPPHTRLAVALSSLHLQGSSIVICLLFVLLRPCYCCVPIADLKATNLETCELLISLYLSLARWCIKPFCWFRPLQVMVPHLFFSGTYFLLFSKNP